MRLIGDDVAVFCGGLLNDACRYAEVYQESISAETGAAKALLDHDPPVPDRRRAVPDCGRRRHVRVGTGFITPDLGLFATAHEAVAVAMRHLPSGLGPVTPGG
ncbi:hypothetical protein [Streptomyces sp. NPDC088707]|uniref:hypothetical protein n=1 Tax=Streptomyces sp. NPDC088707 TaxID=3365871 RepID=UPI0038090C93